MQLKLTNQQILAMQEGIAALDGAQQTQIVEGKPVQVFKGYKLAHAARWALARNAGKLQAAIADFNRAKSALIAQHTDGGGAISGSHPKFNDFANDFQALAQQPVELELDVICLSHLNMEQNEKAGNEFSIAVLNALQPIIADEPLNSPEATVSLSNGKKPSTLN